ncbi:MAG: hypothetical protein IT379_06135 [Deltaproteobacteria bacterium]|nr:hypothetical protein [Deltaproteobacteria bacterium]
MGKLVACALLLAACGGAARETSSVVGRSDRLPVEWTVFDGEGVPVRLERMRGRVLLVWVFATYDAASIAMVDPLNRLVERRGDQVGVIGVAAQPNARQLLPLFGEAMRLRFQVTWDPEGHVLGDASPLGPIDLVPTLVVLDRRGYRLGAHPGPASDQELGRIVARALRGDAPE